MNSDLKRGMTVYIAKDPPVRLKSAVVLSVHDWNDAVTIKEEKAGETIRIRAELWTLAEASAAREVYDKALACAAAAAAERRMRRKQKKAA